MHFKWVTLSFLIIPASPLAIGRFTNAVINFFIVAAAIYFMVVIPMNAAKKRLKKQQEQKSAPPPEPSEEVKLLRGILEELKKVN